VSATRVTAAIPASDIAAAGTPQVRVVNPTPGGGASTAKTFTVTAANPVPTVGTLTPSSAEAGGAAFTLTVDGSSFVTGAVVQWNGAARTTTYVSATRVTAAIPASDIGTAGTPQVRVVNPTPGGGASTAKTFTATACPKGLYFAQYYNNTTLTGTPVFTRCESSISYDWRSAGPGNGVASDNFSVRWSGRFDFNAATHTITATASDGIRVWVDGASVINSWVDQATTTRQGTVSISAGEHDIKVEYYERTGSAVAKVYWQSPTFGTCQLGQFLARYYINISLSGTPTLTRCESSILYNWGSGGPGGGVSPDNFSVRWTGSFPFRAGSYTFKARVDDGVRMWVGGTQIISAWKDQAPTLYQSTRTMAVGNHTITVEYYERGGGAVAEVTW
jgi:hypothetical protein